MPRPFFYRSRIAITRIDDAINRYNESVSKHLKDLQRTRGVRGFGSERANEPNNKRYRTVSRADERIKFFKLDHFKDEVREPLNWSVVWLVAKNEFKSRNEVLRYRVLEFVEVVIHALEEKSYGS